MTVVEICVDSADGARVAEQAGADRVELCAGLIEGGTTPSIGAVRATLDAVAGAGVQVLIRPRGGDFLYSATELRTMLADIDAIRELAAAVPVGFVLGALTPDGEVDARLTGQLVAACGGAPVTFHKAFDLTRDLSRSLGALIDLGIGRVLTSGGAALAADGASELARLVRQADGRIAVLAGGGVRARNVARLVAATGVPEVHLRAARTVDSAMAYRREGVRISARDHELTVTSAEEVRAVLTALDAEVTRGRVRRPPDSIRFH